MHFVRVDVTVLCTIILLVMSDVRYLNENNESLRYKRNADTTFLSHFCK